MIERVVLKDFLSYADGSVELGGSTVAVTGENGAGKSSLLEAIPYAYYGLGRETMAGMSRIGGDGSHEVRVLDTRGVEVRRGRKPSGTGYFEIRENGELVAKGREADAWVEDYIGMDSDTFMLTAFFGLHDVRHDPLIRVTPSVRLEALQKLADVGPYRSFLKTAKAKLQEVEDRMSEAESRKDGAESALADEDKIRASMEGAEEVRSKESDRLLKLKTKRDDLRVKEEKYQAFVSEKERLSAERSSLDREIRRLSSEIESMDDSLESLAEQIESDLATKKKCVADEVLKTDPSASRERLEQIESEIGSTERMVELKSMATEAGASTRCPLCRSKISPETVAQWERDVEELSAEIDRMRREKHVHRTTVSRYDDISRQVKELGDRIQQANKEASATENSRSACQRELKKVKAEKRQKDAQYIDLQEKLGDEYQGIKHEVDSVNEEIDECTDRIHEAKSEIATGKGLIQHNSKAKKIISEATKLLKELRADRDVYKYLTKAWNRYGIPMRLIQRTMEAIEARATAVYQEFDSGQVVVREVEDRGKPGVDFFLVDRKGERTFNQLSAGEKVMFFVAVRVAIAQLVAEHRAVSVDYLILDEAMGNLSPKRRDDLVRLINKVLRKLFPQVIMVSHTEMRDIFSQTIRVTAGAVSSEIEVVV